LVEYQHFKQNENITEIGKVYDSLFIVLDGKIDIKIDLLNNLVENKY
jgi:hypothetical protein